MAQHPRYSFIKGKDIYDARRALMLTVLSLAVLIGGFVYSVIRGGQAGRALGAVGLAGMLTAFCAFGYGLRGLAHHGKRARLPAAGALASGLASIVWLAVYFSGF